MPDQISNDNDGRALAPPHSVDAHGHAAMLLVESLIHGLVSRSVISVADAVEIVGIALDVKEEVAAELGDSPETLRQSLTLLNAISASLANDIITDEPPVRPVS